MTGGLGERVRSKRKWLKKSTTQTYRLSKSNWKQNYRMVSKIVYLNAKGNEEDIPWGNHIRGKSLEPNEWMMMDDKPSKR